MTRPATKAEMFEAVQLLSSLRKPKDMPAVVLDAYEIALQGVTALALTVVTKNMLQGAKFMPSPSELRIAINEMEHREERQRKPQIEVQEVLTPGQKLGFPLLSHDPAARQRCSQRWQELHQASKAAEPQLTESERLERLKQRALEPVQPTEALLRTLGDVVEKG